MIEFPDSAKELENKAKADVQNNLANSNPFLKNSFLGALITGYALRVFDFYLQLQELLKQMFVQTATGDFLVMFGDWFGVTRDPSTQSTGSVVFTGIDTTLISGGTVLQSGSGLAYTTDSAANITSTIITAEVGGVTRSGSTVTFITEDSEPHNLATGIDVVISGADLSDYNGTVTITVTAEDTFNYEITGVPASPATGTIIATVAFANVAITSDDFGQGTNQDSGAALTLTSPIGGVNNTAFVDFLGLGGGADVQSDTDFRTEVIFRVQNPVAGFNVAAIIVQARTVPGVTRVFVQEITPATGSVTVYFVRDNDADIIPDGSEVQTVKDTLDLIRPANTPDENLIVAAPTATDTAFFFTAMEPNTTTMQDAVTASLTTFFNSTSVGTNVTRDAYRAAIQKTIDRTTGNALESFTLSTPNGTITAASDELPTLGTITFP